MQTISDINDQIKYLEYRFIECGETYKLKNKIYSETLLEYPNADLSRLDDVFRLLDFQALLTICALDMLTVVKLILNSDIAWEQKYLTRKGYLLLYEALVAYNKKQNNIRNLSNTLSDLELEFSNISKVIREFKKEIRLNEIELIRNKVSAHIDGNFNLFYKTIQELNADKCYRALRKFGFILVKLIDFLSRLQRRINSEVDSSLLSQEIEIEKLRNEIEELK